MKSLCPGLAGLSGLLLAHLASVPLATSPAVGAPRAASKTIAETVAGAKELRTLAELVKASGVAETLSGPGPLTVFAPTDVAFKKLPEGAVDNLMRPENKPQLQTVLTYHVVSGLLTAKDLLEKIKEGGGKAQLKTVQGEPLTVEIKGRSIALTDAKGGTATVAIANQMQSNGVVHVVNAVLLP